MGESGLYRSNVDRFSVSADWGDYGGGWAGIHGGSCFGFGQHSLIVYV